MAHLMIRDDFPLAWVQKTVLLFEASHDALDGSREIHLVHRIGASASRHQGRLVDEIREVRPRESGSQGGDRLEVGYPLRVDQHTDRMDLREPLTMHLEPLTRPRIRANQKERTRQRGPVME